MTVAASGLIADIGATNSRFALLEPGGAIARLRVIATEDFASLTDAIDGYLVAEAPRLRPTHAKRRCSI